MIIETFFEKFCNKPMFLTNIWSNFTEIASISEANEEIYQENPENPKKFLTFLNNKIEISSKLDLTEAIQKNLRDIKLLTLAYSLEIFGYFCKLEDFQKKILNKNLELFKIFLIVSDDDKVLLRTCECIEFLKSKFLFAFKNICIFDVQIEEILVSKRSQMFKNNVKFSIKSAILMESPAISPMIPLDFSLEDHKNDEIGKKKSILMIPVKMTKNEAGEEKRQKSLKNSIFEKSTSLEKYEKNMKKPPKNVKIQTNFDKTNDSSKNSDENQEIEEDPVEKEKKIKKRFIEELDKWLCFDGNID